MRRPSHYEAPFLSMQIALCCERTSLVYFLSRSFSHSLSHSLLGAVFQHFCCICPAAARFNIFSGIPRLAFSSFFRRGFAKKKDFSLNCGARLMRTAFGEIRIARSINFTHTCSLRRRTVRGQPPYPLRGTGKGLKNRKNVITIKYSEQARSKSGIIARSADA